MKKSEREPTRLCPTLCNPMDCRLPRSSVHGIFQAKVLEWVAISFAITSKLTSNYKMIPFIEWVPGTEPKCKVLRNPGVLNLLVSKWILLPQLFFILHVSAYVCLLKEAILLSESKLIFLLMKLKKWKWRSHSYVQLFVTLWTIQSMEFSKPEYWSG